MKRLSSLIVAVAMLAGVSCTTDVTNDLAIGNEGKTVLTISLDDTSRIALGDKNGSEYTALWSEGDKISVNGIASNEAAIDASNPAVASFSFEGALSTPYHIVYPAALKGQVVFAPEQSFENGTFSAGATPLYGYSEDGAISLHHLAAVLKFGVTGSATLLTAQVSTIDRAPIAGPFLIDCATGEVLPTESATESVNYSFGEGLALSNEPQYIHLAVPAGVYGELYVTLFDAEGGVMYATIKADEEKPLKAGMVREYKNAIAYAAEAELFVIKDVATLKEFAASANSLQKDAVLVKDIDMQGEDWTPIEGYAKTLHGNGYSIYGLNAPLFGTTSASIKGLHLEGVNISEQTNPNVGAFARAILATEDNTPTIEYCSAKGAITVSCEATDYAHAYTSFAIGGLVGHIQGVSLTNCKSDIAINVTKLLPAGHDSKTYIYPSIAGLVGYVDAFTKSDSTIITSNILESESNGDVSYSETTFTGFSGAVGGFVAGAIGYVKAANLSCNFNNITNRGDVTITGFFGAGAGSEQDPCLAGAIGYLASASCKNISNYGKVTYTEGKSRAHYIGGVIGTCAAGTLMEEIHNYGIVDLQADSRLAATYCAGVIASLPKDASLNNSSNNKPIYAQCQHEGGSAARPFFVGGVAAISSGEIINCHNNKDGKITCQTTINYIHDWKDACVAGLVARQYTIPVENSSNSGDIDVNITVTKAQSIDDNRIHVGGVIGLSAQPCNNVTNYGNISVAGSYGRVSLGGVIGDMNYAESKDMGGYYNHGAISIADGTHFDYITYIGGAIGYTKGVTTDVTNYATGKITIGAITTTAQQTVGESKFDNYTNIGGCVGYCEEETGIINTANNSGSITIANGATFSRWAQIGGVVGHSKGTISGITNHETATITVNNATFSYISLIAGCVARGEAAAKGSVAGATNKAQINIADGVTYSHSNYIGGCVGLTNNAVSTLENTASATITIGASTAVNTEFIGGCVARSQTANGTVDKAINRGCITAKMNCTGSITQYIGGVVGEIAGAAVTASENFGAMNISSSVDGGRRYIAGICPQMQVGGSNLTNHDTADITVELQKGSNTYVSGVCGYAKADTSDLLNQGDITINGSIAALTIISGCFSNAAAEVDIVRAMNEGNITINGTLSGDTRVSGLQGDSNTIQRWTDCYNKGALTISQSANISNTLRIGGISAYIRAKTNTFSGCYNTGAININPGATITKAIQIGGFAGAVEYTTEIAENGFYNTGNIFVNNNTLVDETLLIGGVAGKTTVAIENARCLCDVVAPGYSNLGMIMGSPRSEGVTATNCKIGGRFANRFDTDNDDTQPYYVKIDDGNYIDYIYGSGEATDWNGTSNYDGCTFISQL